MLGQAQAALNDAGGFDFDAAKAPYLEYERQLCTVRDNRAAIDEDLAVVGLSAVPDTLEERGEFVRRVERDAQKEERVQREGKDAAYVQ